MVINVNLMLIIAAFVLAVGAIYLLYTIIMYKGNKNEADLQLTTKNALEQVEILFNKNEYALAELLASKYLDKVPNHIEVRKYLAKACFKNKKYNSSIKQCLIILRKRKDDVNTKKLLGECYIKKGAVGKALKEFEEIFEVEHNDPKVLETLAELYTETEQYFSAITVYNMLVALLTIPDEVARIYTILADLNEKVNDYPAAFEAYKNRLEIYPTDIETNKKLAELYIKINNNAKAIETLLFMLTIVVEPKMLMWVYESLISIFVDTEEYEKAIEYSEKLIEVQGADKFKIKKDIANFYVKLNNYSAGIALLEDLVMLSQNGYEVTTELASAYIKCKEYQKALNKYLELLDMSTPKEAKAVRVLICDLYIIWAIDCTLADNFVDSYKYLNLAEQYNPTNSEIFYNIAKNQLLQKNYSVVIEYISKALNCSKDNEKTIKYYLLLADAHHALGNFFEEKKALSDLLKIDEKNAMGLYKTGLLYMALHDTKNAEEFLKKALDINPTLIDAKFNLAVIYENNNKDKAKELYLEILDQEPNHEQTKSALIELTSTDY